MIIGLTGSFGTGKTTVAEFFKECGAIVLDADKVAHKALRKNTDTYKKILKVFGKDILTKNNKINRKLLGRIVFADKLLLKKLCSIVHPYVIKKIKAMIKGVKGTRPDAVIVLDIPLLVEAGLLRLIDRLVVVKTDKGIQVKRCRKKTGLNRKQILARIGAQMPIKEKIRFSDFVIDNNGTEKQTKREVRRIWEEIQQQTIQRKRT